jgi:ABC-type uncharacterized transport system auxiliary subunit
MKSIALAMTALVLTACFGGLERNAPVPAVYRLAAPAIPGGPAIGADLLVLRPVVAPGLRTDRVANSWAGNRIDYYAGARWSGEVGPVVQDALVQAFRTAGRLRTVEGDPGRFLATHVLDIEVTRFEADYAAGAVPVARVTLTATVARYDNRKALVTTTVAAETAAGANTLSTVVAALNDAFGKAATEVVQQASDAIVADLAGQPGT